MKKLLLVALFVFLSTITTQAQDSLRVNNNIVKILGCKPVHYIVTNLSKEYVEEHLPILLKVKPETEWIKPVYKSKKEKICLKKS